MKEIKTLTVIDIISLVSNIVNSGLYYLDCSNEPLTLISVSIEYYEQYKQFGGFSIG